MTEALQELLKRPIAFHPILARVGGSVNAGVFLSQLLYWLRAKPGDWNWKSAKDWEEETCLTSKEQRNVRNAWKRLGVLKERARGGYDRTLEFAIDWEVLAEKIQMHCAERANGTGPKGNSNVPKGHSHLQESTAEITSETPIPAAVAASSPEPLVLLSEKKGKGGAHPDHQAVMAACSDAHFRTFGVRPVMGARDGKAANELLKLAPVREIARRAVILAGISNGAKPGSYNRCAVTPSAVLARWNDLGLPTGGAEDYPATGLSASDQAHVDREARRRAAKAAAQ